MDTSNRTQILSAPADPSRWDQALSAFLVEKHRRSGSFRTAESYARILHAFFSATGKTPERVTAADAMTFCFGRGASGRQPAAATIGSRIAAISSFYRFLIRMGFLQANPCDALERPRQLESPARGLTGSEIRRLLAAIPDDVPGRRDRAIVLTLVLTGRRRSEVLNLRAKDMEFCGGDVHYRYRGKGGKQRRRPLPQPALRAIERTLNDCGKVLTEMSPEESLWQAVARVEGVSQAVAYARFRRYLLAAGFDSTGFHILRHSAAKLRREAGDSLETISSFLDHSSLAVTSIYLRRLDVAEDTSWSKVAEAIGV
jgi:site-specific recombinase XerD